MGSGDRFNRIVAAMGMLAEDGLNPVLAVRHRGVIHEFRMNLVTRHLESDRGDMHARTIIDDEFAQFVEGYPSARVNSALADVW